MERKIDFIGLVPSLSFGREFKQVILSPRLKNFPVKFSVQEVFVSLLPSGQLAKVVAQYYHDKYHTDIDSVVTYIRNDV